MKKSIQVQINKPCHENWEKMMPAEQGRFCGSCQKTVIDFTNMTDEELLKWITRPGKDICGKFDSDQLERDLIIYPKKKFSFRYLWKFIVAGFLISSEAEAKQGTPTVVETVIKNPFHSKENKQVVLKKQFSISGSIVDSSDNNPIASASIQLKGSSVGVQSDSLGNFLLEYEGEQDEITLEISSIGYTPKSLVIDKRSYTGRLHISLSVDAAILGEVTVKSYSGRYRLGGATGSVSVVYSGSFFDTLFSSRNEMVVYPNPVPRGASINLSLNFKQAGQYKLELVDAAGRLLLSQSITVGNVKQQESITTSASWSKGIYYLRMSQPGKKFNKATKVVLQ